MKERPKGWKKKLRGDYDKQAKEWIEDIIGLGITLEEWSDMVAVFFWWRDENFDGGEEGRKQRKLAREAQSEVYEYLLLASGEWGVSEEYGEIVPLTDHAVRLRSMAEYLHNEIEPLNLFYVGGVKCRYVLQAQELLKIYNEGEWSYKDTFTENKIEGYCYEDDEDS